MIEHANGYESKIRIENEIITECTNGSERENRIVNKSANKNRSASQTEYMSSKMTKDGSVSGVLNRENMRFGMAYGVA
jgi:hypothetical protein